MIQYTSDKIAGGINSATPFVNEVAKIPLPIGYLLQAIDYDRKKDLRPRVIPASLFTQNESFGLVGESETEGEYINLPFDLLIDESHEIAFDITDHAVENGSVISDHVQQRLRSVEVSGFFSNHSINKRASWIDENDQVLADRDSVELVDVKNGSTTAALKPVARDKWDELKKLAQMRAKVRIITALEVYDEMVIESVSTRRGPDDGEGVRFSVRLREIRTASVESTKRNGVWEPPQPAKLDSPEKKAIGSEKKKGSKSGKEVDGTKIATKLENSKGGKVYSNN